MYTSLLKDVHVDVIDVYVVNGCRCCIPESLVPRKKWQQDQRIDTCTSLNKNLYKVSQTNEV